MSEFEIKTYKKMSGCLLFGLMIYGVNRIVTMEEAAIIKHRKV